jgi:hypothetical protein
LVVQDGVLRMRHGGLLETPVMRRVLLATLNQKYIPILLQMGVWQWLSWIFANVGSRWLRGYGLSSSRSAFTQARHWEAYPNRCWIYVQGVWPGRPNFPRNE